MAVPALAPRKVSTKASPAISVPVGHDKNNLPLGLQLIGKPLGEQTLLNLAFSMEGKSNFKQNIIKWWEK